MTKGLLRLYVTGKAPSSQRAIECLRRLCDEDLEGRFELEIIDVMEEPQLAEAEKILATPTLIKVSPLPVRRLVGDLADAEKVLSRLGTSRRDHA